MSPDQGDRPRWVPESYLLAHQWDFRRVGWTVDELYKDFYTKHKFNDGALAWLSASGEWSRARDIHRFTSEGLILPVTIGDTIYGQGDEGIGVERKQWRADVAMIASKIGLTPGCAVAFSLRACPSPGVVSAGWLRPGRANLDSKPEPDVVEIGVGTSFGAFNPPLTPYQSLHFIHAQTGEPAIGPDGLLATDMSFTHRDDLSASFHVFGFVWGFEADMFEHYADDHLLAKRSMRWIRPDGSGQVPAELIIGPWVGGLKSDGTPSMTGRPQSGNDFPASMAVEWIRVWAP